MTGSVSRAELAAEIRTQVYRQGQVIRKTAKNRREAELSAFKLGQAYPVERYGLTFVADQIPQTTDWAVFARARPLLEKGDQWNADNVAVLLERVRAWGMVYVRKYAAPGAAKTTASRDTADMPARFPELAEAGVKFRSQAVGGFGYGPVQAWAVYAYVERPSAMMDNLEKAAQQ